MTDILEIQVFVSNPGDVNPERDLLEKVCDKINDTLATTPCNVRFLVKNWSKIIGQFGLNPQLEIESQIGTYDIYFGILWTRFGSDTGLISSSTGQDFGSGTLREFQLAEDKLKQTGSPKMYLFFKRDTNFDPFKEGVSDEISKIVEFEKAQKPNGICNYFKDETDFKDQIYNLLWKEAMLRCMEQMGERKKKYDVEFLKIEITAHHSEIYVPSANYIERTISHFSFAKERQNIPFLEIENESLIQLLIKQNRIVLLGDAGSGKSTELLHLFEKLKDDTSIYIPIFQKLNTYTPDIGLETFLPKFWQEVKDTLVIIWDGLDEILPEHFNSVARQIIVFSEKHKEITIIISCRSNFYELPINNSPGTLTGFTPYIINNLSNLDIKQYFNAIFVAEDGDVFVSEVWRKGLEGIATKPFFLSLLSNYYNQNKELPEKRVSLYEMFITNRIQFDKDHFKGVFDIRTKENEIKKILNKVALAMEMLSRNYISESELLEIISSEEFNYLKYCTAFGKKEGADNIWQFEHNNIQEYLAAKALSDIPFDQVIKLITFEPLHNKLIPTWVNTLSFLFSILEPTDELFKLLLQWLLENENEVIVKFEQGKIAEATRDEIFWGIFKYYKQHDIWMSSNKFTDLDLAQFAQSDKNIQLLLDEIKSEENTETVKLNAIQLIGYFKFISQNLRESTKIILVDQIESNILKTQYVYFCITALRHIGANDENTVRTIMHLAGKRRNQSIRSSIYEMLLDSKSLDNYVDYIIEGYEIKIKKEKEGRDSIGHLSEELNLKECVRNVKSANGVQQLLSYFTTNEEFNHFYDIESILTIIVENAIPVFNEDIYATVLNWLVEDIKRFRLDTTDIALRFFNETGTREKAFRDIATLESEKPENRSLALAKLATPSLMHYFIEAYNKHNLTNKDIENIYFDMGWIKNSDIDYFEKLVSEKTDVKINKPVYIDHDTIRKKNLQSEFNMLFSSNEFFKETVRIFDEQEKESIDYDDLFEITKSNRTSLELDNLYSGLSLRLLREFHKGNQPVKKEQIRDWFKKKKAVVWYRVQLMYDYLTNYKDLYVTHSQKKWICVWAYKHISSVDYKNAITVKSNREASIQTVALFIWYFIRRFDIEFSEDIFLDMLSFDAIEGHEYVGIEYLVERLPKDKLQDRILQNIQNGISYFAVLQNHVQYILKNKLVQGYKNVLSEIINPHFEPYQREKILDAYYNYTKDINGLKSIITEADSAIIWEIIEKLRQTDEYGFVEEYLITKLRSDSDVTEKKTSAEFLIKMQNIEGLKYYLEWLKNNLTEITDDGLSVLRDLRVKEALPYLNELLDMSYENEIFIDRLNTFNHSIVDAFYNIALVSEENLVEVVKALETYVTEKSGVNAKAKYLLHTIERISNQFYLNRSQTFTIKNVKEKLQIISN